MKTCIISLILLILGWNYGFSQRQITIYEDFREDSKEWKSSQKSNRGVIKGKKFTLANEVPTYSLTFVKSFDLHPEMDFVINARIKQIGGAKKNSFGLAIADLQKSGHTNWHYFLISGDQQHKVYYDDRENNKRIDATSWIAAPATIRSKGSFNVLTVKKIDKAIQFQINGSTVYQADETPLGAQSLGFLIQDVTNIEIDYLEVRGFLKINERPNGHFGLKKYKMGSEINSTFPELQPVMSYDEKTLYFVRYGHPKNKSVFDDIWTAKLRKDDTWTPAKNIGSPFNDGNNNFVISSTKSGDTLFLGNTYKRVVADEGISVSVKKKGRWSVPDDIIIVGYDRKTHFINYALSSDKKVLISAVKREDTNGESDLYASFQLGAFGYSEPVNMGPVINTPGTETTPFLAPDGKTLYFSSDGHNGYGSNDIFKSRRLDDSWTKWSEPENLGPEINSKDWEGYYYISPQKHYHFMVSGGDIYQLGNKGFKVDFSIRRPAKITVFGRVVSKEGFKPLPAIVTYYDEETDEELGEARANPKNGAYSMTIPPGKKYRFEATAPDFKPMSRFIDATKVKKSVKVKKHFVLTPRPLPEMLLGQARGGEAPKLPPVWQDILFDYNKSELTPIAKRQLDLLLVTLSSNPKLGIKLKGYTDDSGRDNYNQKLSRERTLSVIRYLTTRGISALRIIGQSYGENDPVADNATEYGRKLNRRVEIKLVEDDVYKN